MAKPAENGSHAELHNAYGRIQSSIGIDPLPAHQRRQGHNSQHRKERRKQGRQRHTADILKGGPLELKTISTEAQSLISIEKPSQKKKAIHRSHAHHGDGGSGKPKGWHPKGPQNKHAREGHLDRSRQQHNSGRELHVPRPPKHRA